MPLISLTTPTAFHHAQVPTITHLNQLIAKHISTINKSCYHLKFRHLSPSFIDFGFDILDYWHRRFTTCFAN
jgi:hypothetical protein